MHPPRVYRWAVLHGLPRLLLRRAARNGDLGARIAIDPSVRPDPYPLYAELRNRGPLVTLTLASYTASHAVTRDVLRNAAFTVGGDSGPGGTLVQRLFRSARDERALSPVEAPSMLAVDPPDHTRYRRLVSKVFTARAVADLEPRVASTADLLLDELAAAASNGDPVDLVARYAGLLPVMVIADILGVPSELREQFLSWGNGAAMSLDPGLSYRQFRRCDHDLRALQSWFSGHLVAQRAHPGADLLSSLATLTDEGETLSELELRATALLLLGAGFETTVNLIGNAVVTLLDHPDQLRALLDEPAAWPNAIDEVLRYESPVQVTGRAAARDTVAGGVEVAQGRYVVVMLGGANRDPAVFERPDVFDITRANAKDHLAFSGGIHYCLGASLARLEGVVALRRLFERFPDLALAGQPVRRELRVLRGYEVMPVALRARSAVS